MVRLVFPFLFSVALDVKIDIADKMTLLDFFFILYFDEELFDSIFEESNKFDTQTGVVQKEDISRVELRVFLLLWKTHQMLLDEIFRDN